MTHPLVDQFLVPFILRFFFVFGIVGFAVGIGLTFDFAGIHRFFGIMNRWVSMRHGTRWLAIPRDTGPIMLRFRRSIGAAFVLVAAFSTFVMIAKLDVERVVAALDLKAPHAFVAWILECMRWLLVVGGVVAITVGIMLIYFPKALHAIETRANHWYSFRSYSQSGDAMHMGFDRWIESYPRAMGGVIAVAALVVVVDYGIRLFAR